MGVEIHHVVTIMWQSLSGYSRSIHAVINKKIWSTKCIFKKWFLLEIIHEYLKGVVFPCWDSSDTVTGVFNSFANKSWINQCIYSLNLFKVCLCKFHEGWIHISNQGMESNELVCFSIGQDLCILFWSYPNKSFLY